jgi:hypothetical protein
MPLLRPFLEEIATVLWLRTFKKIWYYYIMMRKSAGYYLLSLISFCIFTLLFQTVADAQSQSAPITPVTQIVTQPTPTIYVAPPTPTLTPSPIPSPTIQPTAIPTPTDTPPTTIVSSSVSLDSLFSSFANQYHVDKNELEKIANCESGFNATSDYDGLYVGMFQFAQQTWSDVRSEMGLDPNPDLRTNATDAIQTAAYMLSRGQQNSWPSCH